MMRCGQDKCIDDDCVSESNILVVIVVDARERTIDPGRSTVPTCPKIINFLQVKAKLQHTLISIEGIIE